MTGPGLSKLIYLLIVGGFIAGIGLLSIGRLVALARLRGGTASEGRIVRKRIDSDDGHFYYVTYAFEDARGVSHQKEIQLRKAAYDSLTEQQHIQILYQASNPENSYLADPRFRRSHLMAMLGWLLLAALLCFVAYNFVMSCVIRDSCPS